MPRDIERPDGSLSAATRGLTPAYARNMRVYAREGAILMPSRSSTSTSSGVTSMLSIWSYGTLDEVVPISDIVSPGTSMSASAGLRHRLITTLLTRCPKISSAPFAGNILMVIPASDAMLCPHMPPALIMRSACSVCSSPVRVSRSFTPVRRLPSRSKSITWW
ncbi:hypothetical protein IMSAG192_00314 [Muribaculaceae bacterium]|nr:hypothetical protein IMSAG192_00314 [Muribaculaceae bacterium]